MTKNSRMKPIALFDMDGSLFDYDGAMIRDLNELRAPEEPLIKNQNLWTMEKQPHMKARMDLIKFKPGWWLDLKPITLGFDIFKMAKEIGYECHILTKGPHKHSNAWSEKKDCIRKHFGEDVPVHIVSNKGLVYGAVLYDDYPEYMDMWKDARPRGLGIMPLNMGNENYSRKGYIMAKIANLGIVRLELEKQFALKIESSKKELELFV